jgi:hypothetical protein
MLDIFMYWLMKLYGKNIVATKVINFQWHTSQGNTNTSIDLITNKDQCFTPNYEHVNTFLQEMAVKSSIQKEKRTTKSGY